MIATVDPLRPEQWQQLLLAVIVTFVVFDVVVEKRAFAPFFGCPKIKCCYRFDVAVVLVPHVL